MAGPQNVGGLNYEIQIKDLFSAATKQFRAELVKSRTAWRQFKNDMKSASKDAAKDAAKDTKDSAEDQRKSLDRLYKERGKLEEKALKRRKATQAEGLKHMKQLESEERKEKKKTDEQDRMIRTARRNRRRREMRERRREAQELARLARDQERVEAATDATRRRRESLMAEARRIHHKQQLDRARALAAQQQAQDNAMRRRESLMAEARRIHHRQRLTQLEEQRRAAQRAQRAFEQSPLGVAQRRVQQAQFNQQVQDLLPANLRRSGSRSQNGALEAANRASFTFRRLIGIFAVFQGIRVVASSFTQVLRDAIDLNAKIEDASTGLAAIFVSSSDVRDATGKAVDNQTAFAEAVKMSKKQIELLRLEGLKTNATFDQLLRTYQSAAAPGREAGLSPSQIRQLTVRIAQTAAAVGLPGNQLDEEVRSLLSGTATSRTTRIAQALGGATKYNEDLRKAREMGTVFEFLTTRLQAFEQAGEAALNNFTGALSNAKDAVLLVVQTGAIDFFMQLKNVMFDVQKLARTSTSEGFEINPRALVAVKGLFSELAGAVKTIRKELSSDTFLSTLGGGLDTLGVSIRIIAEALTGLSVGILEGLKPVGSFLHLLEAVFDKLGTSLRDVAEGFGAGLALMVAWQTLLWTGKGIVLGFKAIYYYMYRLANGGMLSKVFIEFSLIAIALEKITRYFTNDEFGFVAAITSFAASVKSVVEKMVIGFKAIALELKSPFISEEEYQKQLATLKQEKADQVETARLTQEQIAGKKDPSLTNHATGFMSRVLGGESFEDVVAKLKKATTEASKFDLELFNSRKSLSEDVELVERMEQGLNDARRHLEQVRAGGGEGLAKSILGVRNTEDDKLAKLLKERIEERTSLFMSLGPNRSGEPLTQAGRVVAVEKLAEVQQEILTLGTQSLKIRNDKIQALILEASIERQKNLRTKKIETEIAEIETDRLKSVEQALEVADSRTNLIIEESSMKDALLKAERSILEDQRSVLTDQTQIMEVNKAILEIEQERALNARQASADVRALNRELVASYASLDPQTVASRSSSSKTALLEARGAAALDSLKAPEALRYKVEAAREEAKAKEAELVREREILELVRSRTTTAQSYYLVNQQIAAVNREILANQINLNLEVKELTKEVLKGATEDLLGKINDVNFTAEQLADRYKNLVEVYTGETNVLFGSLKESMYQIAAEMPSLFQGTIDVLKGMVEGFAQIVSEAIVEAFDPTADTSLQERFARFLQSIAQQILQMLIQIAIAKAVLGLAGLFGGGAAGASGLTQIGASAFGGGGTTTSSVAGLSFHEGGAVEDVRPRHNLPRPAGIHPADKVGIWTEVGEVITNKKTAQRIGYDFFAAVNSNQIPVWQLRSLLPRGGARAPRGLPKLGFNTGGSVQPGDGTRSSGSVGRMEAYLVPNDRTLNMLLNGGSRSFMSFVSANASAMKRAMGLKG